MTKTLVIKVEFQEDDDFDFYRHRFVGQAEEMAIEVVDGDHDSLPQSDGRIDVTWDVEDE